MTQTLTFQSGLEKKTINIEEMTTMDGIKFVEQESRLTREQRKTILQVLVYHLWMEMSKEDRISTGLTRLGHFQLFWGLSCSMIRTVHDPNFPEFSVLLAFEAGDKWSKSRGVLKIENVRGKRN